jgi:hypothetical protein
MVEVIAGFDPERLDLRKLAKNTTVTKTVKLVGKSLENMKISDIQSTKPELVVAELIEEEGKQALKVTVTSKDKAERISARVTAKTNLEQPKELQLYVYGQVTEDLVVNRTYVLFPRIDDTKSSSIIAKPLAMASAPLMDRGRAVQIQVSSLSEKPFRIKGVTDPAGAVMGFAQQQDDKWKVTLMLVSKPSSPRGSVTLLTDREDQPSIQVRYSVRSAARHNRRPHFMGKADRGKFPGKARPSKLVPGHPRPEEKRSLKLAPRKQVLPQRDLKRVKPKPPAP